MHELILLAEPDLVQQRMIIDYLAYLCPGVILAPVTSSTQMLGLWTRATLIILPQHLTPLSGLEVIRRIRQEDVAIPIVMYSTADWARDAALEAGVTRFLRKAGVSELGATVRELLSLRGDDTADGSV